VPELFPSGEFTVVCLGCEREREIEWVKPGETKYKPCAGCGAVGIKVLVEGQEAYQEHHKKKPFRQLYHLR